MDIISHFLLLAGILNYGKFRGYAFDKMKNGKKYKVLKVNRKFYDKYCKMTQESKK